MSNTGNEVLLNTAHDTDKHHRAGNSVGKYSFNTMKKKRECDTCQWIEKEKVRNKGNPDSGEISLALYKALQTHRIQFHSHLFVTSGDSRNI